MTPLWEGIAEIAANVGKFLKSPKTSLSVARL